MTPMDEFAQIESQLGWLEEHLREQPLPADRSPMEGALNALSCARALIVQLCAIGRGPDTVDGLSAI